MTIAEFSELHGVEKAAVVMYMRRNEETFSGHTSKVKNKTDLDDEAVRLLEVKYPLPKPVQIVEDRETKEKLLAVTEELAAARSKVIELQDKLIQQTTLLSDAKAQSLLLEDKESQIADLKSEINSYKEKNANLTSSVTAVQQALTNEKQRADKVQEHAEELQRQLDEEKAKGFWKRLFRR